MTQTDQSSHYFIDSKITENFKKSVQWNSISFELWFNLFHIFMDLWMKYILKKKKKMEL